MRDNETAFVALSEVWRKSAEFDGWYVGRFVLMPDHVHFFAMTAGEAKALGVWNKMWKSVTARRLAKKLKIASSIWRKTRLITSRVEWNPTRQSGTTCGKPQ